MLFSYPCLTLWRIVVETVTPLSIGTGRGDDLYDVVLASDANDLPMLPASSMAGVLRAAYASDHDESEAAALFGYAAGDDGHPSRVEISHGHIHDSKDSPVLGFGLREPNDPLLAPLLSQRPASRKRVCIDHRGVAAEKMLFDRSVLPAGHRFSVELMLWSETNEDAGAAWLEAVFCGESLRIGGLTRSGFGLLKVVRGFKDSFDLRTEKGLNAFRKLDRDIGAHSGLPCLALPAAAPRAGIAMLSIELWPEAGFRFGGGAHSFQRPVPPKLPDDLPMSESYVRWDKQADGVVRGAAQPPRPLIPATGVKGPIAHRTAFHANRLAGVWAESLAGGDYDKTRDCPTVQRLFGWAPNEPKDQLGQAGVLWWSDLTLEDSGVRAAGQVHNSIDRFTGGVREGALFTAENLHATDRTRPLTTLRVVLDLRRARDRRVNVTLADIHALELALDDLCSGRLALGADGAGGQGFFEGKWYWESGARPSFPATAQAQPLEHKEATA